MNAGTVAMYDSMGVEYVFTGTMINSGFTAAIITAGSYHLRNSSYDPMNADSALYDISVVTVSNTR